MSDRVFARASKDANKKKTVFLRFDDTSLIACEVISPTMWRVAQMDGRSIRESRATSVACKTQGSCVVRTTGPTRTAMGTAMGIEKTISKPSVSRSPDIPEVSKGKERLCSKDCFNQCICS